MFGLYLSWKRCRRLKALLVLCKKLGNISKIQKQSNNWWNDNTLVTQGIRIFMEKFSLGLSWLIFLDKGRFDDTDHSMGKNWGKKTGNVVQRRFAFAGLDPCIKIKLWHWRNSWVRVGVNRTPTLLTRSGSVWLTTGLSLTEKRSQISFRSKGDRSCVDLAYRTSWKL